MKVKQLKKISTLISKISIIKRLTVLGVMMAVFYMAAFTSLAAQGTVTAEVNIRKEASTDSEIVGSTTKGKTIDILDAVKDASGTVWYKVSIANGGYGYIRSDYVKTSEQIEVSAGTSSGNTSSGTSKPADTVPTSIGETPAVVGSSNVKVRSGASTQHELVNSLPSGTSITLIGEAKDSSGNKWYQITADYNGRTVEGYVRADLISTDVPSDAGEQPAEGGEGMPEGSEGESAGETQPEGSEGESAGETQPEGSEAPVQEPVEEHNDYEIVYAQNSEGQYEYYFYDRISGTQQRVSNLLAVVDSTNQLEEQVKNEKIIIFILAGVIVVFFIVLTILLFKIRSLYYDYEEEEEEEEEEEPVPVKRRAKRRVEEEEEEAFVPVKKKRPAASKNEANPTRGGKQEARARETKELHAAEIKEPVKKPMARKPQNFLIDDDEFEFEFLNMDDKDL